MDIPGILMLALCFHRLHLLAQGHLVRARVDAEEATSSKYRFFSCMAHEMRTPLFAVLSSMDLVLEMEPKGGVRDLLLPAQVEGEKLSNMLDEVLAMAKFSDTESVRIRKHASRGRLSLSYMLADVPGTQLGMGRLGQLWRGLDHCRALDPAAFVNNVTLARAVTLLMLSFSMIGLICGGVFLALGRYTSAAIMSTFPPGGLGVIFIAKYCKLRIRTFTTVIVHAGSFIMFSLACFASANNGGFGSNSQNYFALPILVTIVSQGSWAGIFWYLMAMVQVTVMALLSSRGAFEDDRGAFEGVVTASSAFLTDRDSWLASEIIGGLTLHCTVLMIMVTFSFVHNDCMALLLQARVEAEEAATAKFGFFSRTSREMRTPLFAVLVTPSTVCHCHQHHHRFFHQCFWKHHRHHHHHHCFH
jgi:hypothetical protein